MKPSQKHPKQWAIMAGSHGDLYGSAALVVIGIALLVLAPARQSTVAA
jgi:hypothetical protein